MEQANQQTIQKTPLPIKTKIAAWWMITLGVVGVAYFVYLTIHLIRTLPYLNNTMIYFLIACFLSSLFLLFSGLILFTKKRWAWWLSIVMFVILIMIEPFTEFSVRIELFTEFSFSQEVLMILLSVPLALLLLDRESFWGDSQEISLPIKTKIIAILILLIGGHLLIISVYCFYQSNNYRVPHQESYFFGAIAAIIFGSIFFIPGLLILLKKTLGWWLAIIIVFIITAIVIFAIIWNILYTIFWTTHYDIVDELLQCLIVIIPLIPLIILILDRKNFFKIAS